MVKQAKPVFYYNYEDVKHMHNKLLRIVILSIILAWAVSFSTAETVISAEKPDFKVIIGEWVRPDGGYIVRVRDVNPDGSVDVGYFNPGKINIAEAKELEKLLRKYLIIGGMPGVVSEYLKDISPEEINMVQTSIIKTYQADFSKYSSTAKHKYLKDVFISAPRMVGERYKYSHVNPNIQSRDLKDALWLLEEAQCLNRVIHSSGHGVPLGAQTNEKKFKILFLDVGLMQRSLGLGAELMFHDNLLTSNLGGVIEQYVGQEILAASDWYEGRNIYFWARDAKSSSAEVDYLVTSGSTVYPVEVKSGKTGTLKSMRLFLKEHPSCPLGIRFSMKKLSFYDRILSIPLYMVKHWERIVKIA